MLAVLLAMVVWLKRLFPIVSFAIAWFFLHSLLESSIVGLELVYEHRMYLPMLGICAGVAYAFVTLLARHRFAAAVIGMGLIVFLGSSAFLRNAVWQDRLTLWVDVVTKSLDSARARNNLGRALVDKGRHREAHSQFTEALFQQPDSAEAHNNLGVLLANEGRHSESLHHFRQALAVDPGYAQARHNYGRTLFAMGRTADAIANLRGALAANPRYAKAHITLATVLLKAGEIQSACEHLEAAQRLQPRHPRIETALTRCAQLD